MKLKPYNIGACGMNQTFNAGEVKYNDTGVSDGIKLFKLPAGTIITKAVAVVGTAFNAATTNVLTVGFKTSKNEIMASADITAGTAATYLKSTFVTVPADGDVYVKYTQTGTAATAGKATIYLEIIPSPEG